ncbi:MAG: hypothetical protein QOE19_300 [Actinomycetota bacterium]|jgi:ribosomal protein S18 acetylase RimI-like enzyme|nr:hypothetical protein [Actinomycetota bacterium]
MTRLRLDLGDRDDGVVETAIRRALHDFNVETTGLRDGRMLVGSLRDESGRLVGGLYGWTWGATAFIDLLWVDAALRDQGIGSRLLDAAESEARLRGCHQVVLDTHGFQAPGFYLARGYIERGRVDGYPVGSYQLHLAKPLT